MGNRIICISRHKLIRVAFLLFCDVIIINLASFLALFVRFEFSLDHLLPYGFLGNAARYAVLNTIVSILLFLFLKLYNSLWEYASGDELALIAAASVLSALTQAAGMWLLGLRVPRSFPILYAIFLFVLLASFRYIYRISRRIRRKRKTPVESVSARKRTMLIGAGQGGSMALREFQRSDKSANNVVCIIDDDKNKRGLYLMGVRVAGGREDIPELAEKYLIEEIIFAIPTASPEARREILEICLQTNAKLKSLPALYQLANGETGIQKLREIDIEDLLGRAPAQVDATGISEYISGKTILVTGGGGSIGSELCRQLAIYNPGRLIIFDIYENGAYELQQEIKKKHPALDLDVLIGSVRDELRVNQVFAQYRPQLVFHAAAHKHVPLMEDSPSEAIKNNVFGTYNVALAADKYGVERFILVSSDKAVNPTNVMGASKRICEMIVQCLDGHSSTEYSAVRFGNVLGSNGSVIPLFRRQIEEGGPVTVTDKEVTRFFMTIPEAVSLILEAGVFAHGGEVFVLDMGEPVKIDALARKMIRLAGLRPDMDIEIKYIGLRPGEKLYEELLLKSEGLQKTGNDLIFIGQQKRLSKTELIGKLNQLKEVIDSDPVAAKNCIMSIIDEVDIAFAC